MMFSTFRKKCYLVHSIPKNLLERNIPHDRRFSRRPCGKNFSEFSTAVIRNLAEEDLAEVLAVERASQPLPWWEASFRNELDNPFSTVAVLWQKNELAGYICYHVVLDELTILNLVIAPPFRRPGAARLLLKRTLADASRQNAKKGFLEVRKENHAAIALYQ